MSSLIMWTKCRKPPLRWVVVLALLDLLLIALSAANALSVESAPNVAVVSEVVIQVETVAGVAVRVAHAEVVEEEVAEGEVEVEVVVVGEETLPAAEGMKVARRREAVMEETRSELCEEVKKTTLHIS